MKLRLRTELREETLDRPVFLDEFLCERKEILSFNEDKRVEYDNEHLA
jgi:hypothetical protein